MTYKVIYLMVLGARKSKSTGTAFSSIFGKDLLVAPLTWQQASHG